MHPVVFVVLLVLLLLFVSWLKRAPPTARTKALITVGVVAVLLLVATGRMNWVFAALAGIVALGQRLLAATQLLNTLKSFKSAGNRSPGKTSEVETGFLRMCLNHDTGQMSGDVVNGRFKGRALDSLSSEELRELHAECTEHDQQSVAVLEAYLDRRFGDEWRSRGKPGPEGARVAHGNRSMSVKEAREILGVTETASHEQIIEAHRRLMQRMHPDRGGSTYLAAKINQAKDLLLET